MQAADAGSGNALERFFKFKQWDTSIKRDTLAGLATFMVMAYIIFVNPNILGLGGDPKGLPFAAALTSTCLVAGVMTILMGLVTNRAYAIAPGMGLNAVVAFSLVLGQGLTMAEAMGLIVLEGVAILILVLTGFREAIFKAIPIELKKAIVVGIGFFILFIGLVDGGLINVNGGTPVGLVELGTVPMVPLAVTVFGLVITIVMLALRWRAAILLGIVFATDLRDHHELRLGQERRLPPGAGGHPHRHRGEARLQPRRRVRLRRLRQARRHRRRPVDLQPHAERLLRHHGHARRRGRPGRLPRREGRPPAGEPPAARRLPRRRRRRRRQRLVGDHLHRVRRRRRRREAAPAGWRSSSASSSWSAMFFSPIFGVVPGQATAAALVIVGYLMMATLTKAESEADHDTSEPKAGIDFGNLAFGLPAVLIITIMPLTYSITNGIGAGFIAYTLIRVVQGKAREVSWMLWVASFAFILYFIFPCFQAKGWV